MQRSSGAALMLSLWALFLLSAMVISWALAINSQLTLSGSASRILEAQAMACSGAEVALHPKVKPYSPNLRRRINARESYEVRMTGEGGRLNLNILAARLLAPQPNDLSQDILRRYLENKGIDLNERDHMINCLLDWVDLDNLLHLNGAEDSEDYHPANRLFARIDELKKVKGWAEFTSTPGWDDDFTLYGSGVVDLAWASRDVLLALPDMTEARVDNFLQMRRGSDGVDGTQDDPPFKLEEALGALGFTDPKQVVALRSLVTFNPPSPVFRVMSVGKSGEMTRTVQMVVQNGKAITWKEF